jgi:hypothetical protein
VWFRRPRRFVERVWADRLVVLSADDQHRRADFLGLQKIADHRVKHHRPRAVGLDKPPTTVSTTVTVLSPTTVTATFTKLVPGPTIYVDAPPLQPN